ncbi:hypothetical protein K458DRAFT_474271 [Lentithecium fluviatile CBS 122367]|uniref:Uncharacterized protein n=1 Tax=Lentithecium fluviatile CBS 122367 TaxID=1168545 RepID=A0A6G1JHX0_9PLEO|nr:hypothetical protein K458DRAFT_474271 [Lentithecium fluviatile CBS 122367]
MAQPATRRTAAHATRAISIPSTTPSEATTTTYTPSRAANIPPAYLLPPTIPSPYTGTLEASLDAILDFTRVYPNLRPLTAVLLADVDLTTNWPVLLQTTLKGETAENEREMLEEIMFLVTRVLLPEQVAENRALMLRLYEAKKTTSVRVSLRYDMLRKWTRGGHAHDMVVESRPALPPPLPSSPSSIPVSASRPAPPPDPISNPKLPARPPFRPNVLATLIAAPAQYTHGYPTRKLGEAMRHHVTELDRWMLLTDEEVAQWEGKRLWMGVCGVLVMWQWLRRDTEVLGEMEVGGWQELGGRVDECEWIREGR